MNSRTTRIIKEARALFWPWCVVTVAGALQLVLHQERGFERGWNVISPVCFFGGIPLLATLSLGNEFQHRTLSLLLSQPVSRMEIWREKLSVTIVAVLSAALVFYYCGRSALQQDPWFWVVAGVYVITATASATFWTLSARSTLGGLTLNLLQVGIIEAVAYLEWILGIDYLSHANISVVSIALLCYGGVMLWLGGRKLARFQVTGGMAGDDLLMAGPSLMPEALAEWFRCRPTGAVLNLIRKELRLLRPVWLLTILAALAWTCLTVFRLVDRQGSIKNFEIAAIGLGVICTLMIAILAGSLSLGEERNSGTHAWHMTLPVSAFLQWRIKLVMALFAGFVGAGLLPALIAGRFLVGQSRIFADVRFGIGWLLGVLILIFAAFWCACAVNGTVGAVLWVIPVTIALGLAIHFGNRGADKLMDFLFSSWLNPFANFRFDWGVAHVAYGHFRLIRLLETPTMHATLVGGPALLLALIQSYRLFRAQLPNSTVSVVRNLLPLAMLVFLCGFSLTAFNSSLYRAGWQVQMLVGATSRAIQNILPSAAKLDARHPLQLTGDDVLKGYPFPFPKNTRLWLRNARITVTPGKSHPSGFSCVETQRGSTWCSYSATIYLADGTELTQSYEPDAHRKLPFGHLQVHARWPGTEGQESLWDR